MDDFDRLDGYEKGVVARMLLDRLVKQGSLQQSEEGRGEFTVVIPVAMWQLQMLARYSDDSDDPAIRSKPAIQDQHAVEKKERPEQSDVEVIPGTRWQSN